MSIVVVLGATGTIGLTIVRDLVESGVEVIAADLDGDKLKELKEINPNKIDIKELDITDKSTTVELLKKGKVCVNATNYVFNINVMKAAAEAGVSVLDLGGLYTRTNEQLKLDQEMKDADILSITGMGSDPGTSNVFSRYGVEELDQAEEIHIRYGSSTTGITFSFAIDTYIGEFLQDAVAVKDGEVVSIPPLGDEEDTQFHGKVGMQKTYSIIHSELATLPKSFPDVKRITYKDTWDASTIDKLESLKALGLLDENPLTIRGEEVIPRRQTVSLVQAALAQKETPVWGTDALLVEVKGRKNGNKASVKLELLTEYQSDWEASPTQYATAIPASIVAQMILNGEISGKGVKPAEQCVDPYKYIEHLKEKNVELEITYSETR
ncbi:saccharopine dehydrogenase family protein [Salinicoccus kekensis]|uniref:Saccharopine dehydrogenase-like NADP-dependent oxidoreductase n=1 Tax=Salinicoccus kekensis TaxID=714307 RepID=A0A285USV4_9STAP|nr:SDR family NAD(P)-dependent oxidoreductase [Salinicoccus kekensis]SOC43766.1 saccharopine dehydrogenase-like NADP-dependent oxidoreductase [Salinicoccus kekensis]